MTLALPFATSFGFSYRNEAGGSTAPGTQVTPGASGAEGNWTQIAASSDIAGDVEYLLLGVSNGAINATQKDHLVDIGYDPAGGTSYTERISDVNAGASAVAGNGGRWFQFPLFIPAGSSVAARVKGSASTANTVRIFAQMWGDISHPDLWKRAGHYESVGISGSAGTTFTPGTNSFGSWVDLGALVQDCFWFQTGLGISSSTLNAEATRVQMAVGNGTNYEVINDFIVQTGTSETIGSPIQSPCTRMVSAGSHLYVRGYCGGTPASGYHASAHCMG